MKVLFCLRFNGHSCEHPPPNRGTCCKFIIIGFGKHTHAHTSTHILTHLQRTRQRAYNESRLQRKVRAHTVTYPYPHNHMLKVNNASKLASKTFEIIVSTQCFTSFASVNCKLKWRWWVRCLIPRKFAKCSKKPLVWGNGITPGERTRAHCWKATRTCQRLRCNVLVLFEGPNLIVSSLFCVCPFWDGKLYVERSALWKKICSVYNIQF